jgi:hypothetical protein
MSHILTLVVRNETAVRSSGHVLLDMYRQRAKRLLSCLNSCGVANRLPGAVASLTLNKLAVAGVTAVPSNVLFFRRVSTHPCMAAVTSPWTVKSIVIPKWPRTGPFWTVNS